jgi:hypothetical protein
MVLFQSVDPTEAPDNAQSGLWNDLEVGHRGSAMSKLRI